MSTTDNALGRHPEPISGEQSNGTMAEISTDSAGNRAADVGLESDLDELLRSREDLENAALLDLFGIC